MEIYWHIKGKYQKIAKDGETRKATPLKTIINDIQAIATQQKYLMYRLLINLLA